MEVHLTAEIVSLAKAILAACLTLIGLASTLLYRVWRWSLTEAAERTEQKRINAQFLAFELEVRGAGTTMNPGVYGRLEQVEGVAAVNADRLDVLEEAAGVSDADMKRARREQMRRTLSPPDGDTFAAVRRELRVKRDGDDDGEEEED